MAASNTLPRQALGATGLQISRIGFGAWTAGGGDWQFGWGAQDDRESVAAIRRAVERGVNWIDTAAFYGLGHSEAIVAAARRDLPAADRPLVITKGGLVPQAGGFRRIAEPQALRRELEGSLRRLGVEAIDVYLMHWPPEDGTALETYWQALLDFRREGKVRAVGLSNHDAADLARAEAIGHVDVVQPPFSALQRGAALDIIPWCRQHDTGVVAYSPLASGLLSGGFTAERAAALGRDDWRSTAPDFQPPALARNLALADALGDLARRRGVGTAEIAIAWALSWPGIAGVIAGARRPAQVDGWIGGGSLTLDEGERAEIADALRRTGAGSGPVAP